MDNSLTLAHNHPSRNLKPVQPGIHLIQQAYKAGKLLKLNSITVYHFDVTWDSFGYSLATLGAFVPWWRRFSGHEGTKTQRITKGSFLLFNPAIFSYTHICKLAKMSHLPFCSCSWSDSADAFAARWGISQGQSHTPKVARLSTLAGKLCTI